MQSSGDEGDIAPEGYWTYSYNEDDYDVDYARSYLGVIVPSTFSVSTDFEGSDKTNTSLHGSSNQMMVYGAIMDLDCEHVFGTKKNTLRCIKDAINSRVSLRQLCADCPDFANVTEALEVLRAKVCEHGFPTTCWFMGGTGYRVMWVDPKCCIQYVPGLDMQLEMTAHMQTYLGAECIFEISKLCSMKSVVFNGAHGAVKNGLYFPPIPLDEVPGNTIWRRTDKYAVEEKVARFWQEVQAVMPRWEYCTKLVTSCVK